MTDSSALYVYGLSFVKGSGELLLGVGLAGILEAVFPPFNPAASPWMNLAEGTTEIVLYLLLVGTCSEDFGEMLGGYGLATVPYGSLLVPFLCGGAVAKIGSFISYIKKRLDARRKGFFETPGLTGDTGADDDSDS